jgi:hypothetical protein
VTRLCSFVFVVNSQITINSRCGSLSHSAPPWVTTTFSSIPM